MQVPVEGLQIPGSWHWSPGEHAIGCPRCSPRLGKYRPVCRDLRLRTDCRLAWLDSSKVLWPRRTRRPRGTGWRQSTLPECRQCTSRIGRYPLGCMHFHRYTIFRRPPQDSCTRPSRERILRRRDIGRRLRIRPDRNPRTGPAPCRHRPACNHCHRRSECPRAWPGCCKCQGSSHTLQPRGSYRSRCIGRDFPQRKARPGTGRSACRHFRPRRECRRSSRDPSTIRWRDCRCRRRGTGRSRHTSQGSHPRKPQLGKHPLACRHCHRRRSSHPPWRDRCKRRSRDRRCRPLHDTDPGQYKLPG